MTEPLNEKDVPVPVMQVHDKCPSCGCTEREGETWFNYLRDIGRVSENLPLFNQIQVAVQDPEKIKKQALLNINGKVKLPIIIYKWDTCCKCGTFYTTKTEMIEQEGIAEFQRAPMPQRPPFRNGPGIPFRN